MEPADDPQRVDDDSHPAPEPSPRARRRKAQGGLGGMIGNAIVGFDDQVFRATRPPAILVESAKPVRGLSGAGGATLLVGYPDEPPADEGEPGPAGPPGASARGADAAAGSSR